MSANHENGKANRLANEKSPYLLQHAYTPVDWYPMIGSFLIKTRCPKAVLEI
jgi:hypothetical protein